VSALREHTLRRQNRIARLDRRFGRIGRWIGELSDGPQHERAWKQGSAGERQNAVRIEKLVRDQPVAFLHDRRVPGTRANIDHIAVAPSGIYVFDSKNAKGAVKVDWKGLFSRRRWFLYVGGRDRTSWVEAVERQMDVVQTQLRTTAFAGIPIHGALCMANSEGLPWVGHPELRAIAICKPRHIAKRLRADGPLEVADIRSLHGLLAAALPPA
jgi:hypothetical protein